MSALTPELRLRRALVAVLYAAVAMELVSLLVSGLTGPIGILASVALSAVLAYGWNIMQTYIFTLIGAEPLPLGDYSDYTGHYALKERRLAYVEV